MSQVSTSNGFTLLEILVIVSIIGILLAVILVSLAEVRAKARDTKRLAEIKQLQTALESYYNDHGRYPGSTGGGCNASSPNVHWCNSVESLSGGHWIRRHGVANVLAPYIAEEPIDPRQESTPKWRPHNGGTYFYFSDADAQWYMIVFGLEKYPHPLEEQDGVTACNGSHYHYGSNSNGVITIGVSC